MMGLVVATLIIMLYLAFQSLVMKRACRGPSYIICALPPAAPHGSTTEVPVHREKRIGVRWRFHPRGAGVTAGFPILARVAQLAKSEGIKSISDFIGARYGKSFSVALFTAITAIVSFLKFPCSWLLHTN